jgi:hypothetical protein
LTSKNSPLYFDPSKAIPYQKNIKIKKLRELGLDDLRERLYTK